MTERISSPHKRSSKALWFSLHGWFALPIWGFLALTCITGTLSVLSEEITWLINKESRSHKTDKNSDINYSAITAAVKAHYKDAEIQSIQFTQSYVASRVRISLPDGETKSLYVNQYNGQVQGEITGKGFRGFIVALHGWLLFPWHDNYSVGWYLVTALSIPLLGSILSGLIIYKHFYRVLLRPKLRLSMGRRVFWGDLHRLIAAWSIWFVILMSVSGMWFLIQGVLDHNHFKIYPDKARLDAALLETPNADTTSENTSTQNTIHIDDVITKTKTLIPTLKITYIEFPEDTADTLMIQGKQYFSLLRDSANTINFNPRDGSVVARRHADDLTLTQFMAALLMPLHFGDFAGLTSKLIWFFFGCLMSLLVCSGFIIWTKRTVDASKRIKLRAAPAINNSQLIASTDTTKHRFFLISWLIVLVPIYFFFQ